MNSDINIRLEDVLAGVGAGLAKKIKYSVELVRKAERIALSYDPEDGYFLAFSGGKDSQALYHIAKLAGVRFRAHMNLTSIDPPEVIRFVRTQYPDCEMVKPKDSIFNIAAKKYTLPTMRIRWCCAEFKEMAGAGKVTLIGIRHEESIKRSRRNEIEINNRKFSGSFDEFGEYRKELAKKKGVNIMNASEERTLGCISGKESLIISPIIQWTIKDVWEFLGAIGAAHCQLYDEGWTRIGCINCPMSPLWQKMRENKRYPHVKHNWIRTIIYLRRKYIPKYTDEDGNPTRHTVWNMTPPPLGGYNPVRDGWKEEKERQIAEYIYDWWISQKSYKEWYANTFLQQKINFD